MSDITQPGEFPMPGEQLGSGIVIASVTYREAEDTTIPEDLRDEQWDNHLYTLLLLNAERPYYTVGTGYWAAEGNFEWRWTENHVNIVPAVNGDMLEPDGSLHLRSDGAGGFVADKKPGYIDLGGDY